MLNFNPDFNEYTVTLYRRTNANIGSVQDSCAIDELDSKWRHCCTSFWVAVFSIHYNILQDITHIWNQHKNSIKIPLCIARSANTLSRIVHEIFGKKSYYQIEILMLNIPAVSWWDSSFSQIEWPVSNLCLLLDARRWWRCWK